MNVGQQRVAGAVVAVVATLASWGGLAHAGTAQVSASASVSECRAVDLEASYHAKDAAMSHTFGVITLRNTSGRACVIQGYGGLSYVGGGDGTQIGAAAQRTPGRTPRVVLQPGEAARSKVSATSTAPYPRRECRPTEVDGFRVYAPDETHSLFVRHRTTGCANPSVHLLTHQAYRG